MLYCYHYLLRTLFFTGRNHESKYYPDHKFLRGRLIIMKGSELSKRSFIGGTAALSAATIGAVTVAAVQEGSVKSNMKE